MTIDGLNVPILLIPGVALGQRAAQLPRVTAIAETPQSIGVKLVNELAVRSGTPQPIIERLSKAVVRPAAAPRNADAGTPEAPGRLLIEEREQKRAPATRAGTKAEQEGKSS